MSENKLDAPSDWVDPDDAPELDDAWFASADLYEHGRLIRRGRTNVIGLDADVLEAFRATGPGWPARVNDVLRNWLSRGAA
jgi:hypothetical protein